MMARCITYVLCWLAVMTQALFGAEEIKVDLSVDRTRVSVNDRFVMTVSVSGTMRSIPEPTIENLGNFTVAGSSQSSQISIVNGQVNAVKSISYTLLPGRTGTQTIGPALVKLGSETYRSGTVTVEVTAGGPAAPAPGAPQQAAPAAPGPSPQSSAGDGNLFIQGTVDKKEVYIGEQLVYTFGFYNRLNLADNPEYAQPTFTGFWVETLDNAARRSSRAVKGIIYNVQELSYALFPNIAGEATIPPARLSLNLRNPWDFFDRGTNRTLETSPIKIKVKPLPADSQPPDFSGAVGRFAIKSGLDKKQVKAGEALNLQIVISGSGNLKTIQEPPLPKMADFDIYESKSGENIDRSGGGITGQKTFKYVIVPRREGDYRWPGVSFCFFDPGQERYVTVSAGEIAFTVLPGQHEEKPLTYRLAPDDVRTLGEDIHYIKEDLRSFRPAGTGLFGSPLFWLVHLLPLVFLAAAFAYRRHRDRLLSDKGYARLRGYRRRLAWNLKAASRHLADNQTELCYSTLDRALAGLIGDRLNVETTGMVTDRILDLLESRGLDEQLRLEVRECLEHFAYVRFAPQAGMDSQARSYIKKVRRLADRLEKVL